MKKRLIRYKFNMVEVALALAVLGIGISSILVLFPVGINANRSAIADNNLADIAEYMMGYLRAGCAAEWTAIADFKAANQTTPVASSQFFFSKEMKSSYNDVKDIGETSGKGIDVTDDDFNSSSRKITNNLSRLTSSGNSAYLYRVMTGDIVDFAAVVKVWKDDFSQVKVPNMKADKSVEYINVGTDISVYARALCVEISWPAQAPYEEREKRLFRQEIFNEAFRLVDYQ